MTIKKSKVIMITGGSRGIGAATARLAAEQGYDVCFSYHTNSSAAEQIVQAIERHGQRSLAVQTDLSRDASIEGLWRAAIAEFTQIDALVNNAAILEQQKPLADFDAERLQRIFSTNVIGSILCSRQAVRHMSTQMGGQGGAIVNVSSTASRLGSPNEYIDYAASKAAIDTLTIGLAKEVAACGIRVNAVRPGPVHTDIHASGGEPDRMDRVKFNIPMKRGGQPGEVAEAILFLVSEKASYCTGSILDVSGGI